MTLLDRMDSEHRLHGWFWPQCVWMALRAKSHPESATQHMAALLLFFSPPSPSSLLFTLNREFVIFLSDSPFHERELLKNDKIGDICADVEASAPVAVASKPATPLLLLIHLKSKGRCALYLNSLSHQRNSLFLTLKF